jgi:ankyrin repeat protein
MSLFSKGIEAKRIQEASTQLRTSCWGASLNAFRSRNEVISFRSLWPNSEYLVDVCKAILEVEKEDSLLLAHLCELLLAAGSGDEVVKLIQASVLSPTQTFSYEAGLQFSLLHLACATGSFEVVSYVRKKERNNLWQIKDSQGYTPAQVCFSQEIKKQIPYSHRGHRRQLSSASIGTITHIEDVHKLAQVAGGFYRFLVELQASGYNVNSEKNMKGDCLIHSIVRGGSSYLPHLLYLANHMKANINLPNTHGMTPLCLTAQLAESTLAEVLICVLGADPNLINPRSKWTPLHYAAASGSYQVVSVILDRGADPVKEDSVGCSPEFYAMKNQQNDVAEHIRQFCRDRISTLSAITMEGRLEVSSLFQSDLSAVNHEGKTLLMVAVEHNHPGLVKKVVENVPKDVKDFKDLQNLQTAVTIASQLNHCRCLEILIKYDCHPAIPDIGQKLPLHYACSNHCAECVSLITGTERGLTGLQWAFDFLCKTGGTNAVIRLISEAMKRRQLCIISPALFQAAEGCTISGTQPPDIAAILEPGDDVNPENMKGEWPLYVAALNGRLKMMKELEQRGGIVLHINQQNFNTTLHAAARSGSLSVVKYVVACMESRNTVADKNSEADTFDINTRNLAGATALELAASEGYAEVLQYLIDHNASTCIPGSDGGLLSCRNYDGVQHLLERNRKQHLRKYACHMLLFVIVCCYC